MGVLGVVEIRRCRSSRDAGKSSSVWQLFSGGWKVVRMSVRGLDDEHELRNTVATAAMTRLWR